MADVGMPYNVVENVAPVKSDSADNFEDLMHRRIRRTHSGLRLCPAMLHLYVRQEGSTAVVCSGHGCQAPPAGATTPQSTAPIGDGHNNCMGVQTRRNRSRDGGHKSPTTSDGPNNAESEDGGKATDLEMQGG